MEGSNQRCLYATTGRLSKRRALVARKRQQEEPGGSLTSSGSSSASSSGCSSIETAAVTTRPDSRNNQRATDDDCLEVNEFLYLQQKPSALVQVAAGERSLVERQIPLCCPAAAKEGRLQKLVGATRGQGATMTEFSAFTLRKNLKFQQQGPIARFEAESKQAAAGEECLCCCCTGECCAENRPTASEPDRHRWRRATIVAGAGRSAGRQVDRGGSTLRSNRPRVLRSVPVPPPVVPLYKELLAIGRLQCEATKPPEESVKSSCEQDAQESAPAGAKIMQSLARDPGAPFASGNSAGGRFYCADWEDLRESASHLERRGSAAALRDASGDKRHFEEQSVTWGRRTAGKFLERLKQSLLANFQSNPAELSEAGSCQQIYKRPSGDAQSSSSASDVCGASPVPAEGSGGGSGAADLGASEIYDTPEYNAQSGPESRVQSSSVGSVTKSPMVQRRPAIPPPPPPPPGRVAADPPDPQAQRVCAGGRARNVTSGQVPGAHGHKVASQSKTGDRVRARKTGRSESSEETSRNERGQDNQQVTEASGHAQRAISVQAAGRRPEGYGSKFGRKSVKWAEEDVQKSSSQSSRLKQNSVGQGKGKIASAKLATQTGVKRTGASSNPSEEIAQSEKDEQAKQSIPGKVIKASEKPRAEVAHGSGHKKASGNPRVQPASKMGSNQSHCAEQRPPTNLHCAPGKRHSLGNISTTAATNHLGKKSSVSSHNKKQHLLSVEPEISVLERRRKSIQDGDVFIYPSLYKDLNECQKCSRDNKICNCITSATVSPSPSRAADSPLPVSATSEGKVHRVTFAKTTQSEQLTTKPGQGPDESTSTTRDRELEMEEVRTARQDSVYRNRAQQSPSSNPPTTTIIDQDEKGCADFRLRVEQPARMGALGESKQVAGENNCERHLGRANQDELTNEEQKCDSSTTVTVTQTTNSRQRRSLENVIKDEGDNEEQLTCNMTSKGVGDSFRITTTSIRIGGAHLAQQRAESSVKLSDHHTSIIPIQTISTRRRNLGATKLAKLHASPCADDATSSDSYSSTEESNLIARLSAMPSPPAATNSTSTPSSCAADLDRSLTNSSFRTSTTSSDILDYSPILSGVRDYINTVNTELQVQTATVSGSIGPLLSRAELVLPLQTPQDEQAGGGPMAQILLTATPSPIPGQASLQPVESLAGEGAGAGEIESRTSAGAVEASSHIANVMQVTNFATNGSLAPVAGLDSSSSPKKSIFEGASKDEILEYLEDARERVPEILMAADDVMVISENEVIVVNRLESGSPATPISIVETTEMVASTSSSISLATTAASPIPIPSPQQNAEQLIHISPPQRDQHSLSPTELRQHVIQKLYQQTSTQQFASGATTNLDDGAAGCQVSREERRTTGRQDSGETIQRESLVEKISSQEMISKTSGKGEPDSLVISYNATMDRQMRRDSTSSDGSGNQSLSRQRAIKMLHLQQRYKAKRDSLSSPTSSPPSSASPTSSTTSSNQNTSGNCSAASTFYASSSISCSSPFLALGQQCGQPAAAVTATSTTLTSTTTKAPIAITDITISATAKQPSSTLTRPADTDEQDNAHPLYVDRDDSGLGVDFAVGGAQMIEDFPKHQESISPASSDAKKGNTFQLKRDFEEQGGKLSVIDECRRDSNPQADKPAQRAQSSGQQPTFASSANLMSRTSHGHYATMSRLNNYFMNRHPLSAANAPEATVEFQCLDCDQFIDVDHAKMMSKSNELRLLRGEQTSDKLLGDQLDPNNNNREAKLMTPEQLDRAYIAAMNGLPLCKLCEKKRVERKEIISEFVETELKYGHDLRIIYDEFYRPMQIAGLLIKDQISGVFLNLEELIMAHCKFAGKLQAALSEAHSMGDVDFNTVNIGRLFVESAEMLSTYEFYCIRQGSAACLLARLAKEKELLRIFLRVSQMENTLLRRMNLAAFLMVPVQRVTKYPLLLNRLYKVTAYYHKDRETLRDAQLKVELHLEHINQQTKGAGATNKIWRRISNLSAPISNRRCLINAEDLGYIKLRKTAMDMLKWDRDDTQFIHSGKLHFAPLNEFLTKQKAKPIRYMAAHALLVVLGKPNWKYRPDLVKSNLDCKLMTPTPGGNGIKETALLLFREKNGRFVACREPLFLSNCVLSADCSQYNSDPCASASASASLNPGQQPSTGNCGSGGAVGQRNKLATAVSAECSGGAKSANFPRQQTRSASTGSNVSSKPESSGGRQSVVVRGLQADFVAKNVAINKNQDAVSMSSVKSLPDSDQSASANLIGAHSNHATSARSYSLASALTPNAPLSAATTAANLTKSGVIPSASNMTIIGQLRTKVGIYHKQVLSAPPISNPDQQNSLSSGSQQQSTKSNSLESQDQTTLSNSETTTLQQHHLYNHHFFHNHHQPYGDYEESFEIHERISKESMLMRADTPLKTRYWLQMLRYHAKDLGQWRARRNGLANIMMMRQE